MVTIRHKHLPLKAGAQIIKNYFDFFLCLQGHKKVAELWQASSLQWTDFIPKNQIDDFLVAKVINKAPYEVGMDGVEFDSFKAEDGEDDGGGGVVMVDFKRRD